MKSITTRRAVAASLAVAGLSGLGLAAAAQLNMTWAGSFQAGATVVTADCQTGPIATQLGTPIFDGSKAIQCRWKLYKLNKRTGEAQWEWFQTRRGRQVAGHGRTVGLLFGDELQVLKSIAL